MKDFLRKLLASLLCICMIGSGLPVSAIAEAMQDSATPPEQQSVSGGAEEQGGQSAQTQASEEQGGTSAQTQASEEQGGTSAQTQVSANEANGVAVIDEVIDHQTFNLQKSLGIMPIAVGQDFKANLYVNVSETGDNNEEYSEEAQYDVGEGAEKGKQRIYFKLVVENTTTRELVLHLKNTLNWNGVPQTSPNQFVYPSSNKYLRFQDNVDTSDQKYSKTQSAKGASLEVEDNYATLRIPARETVELSNRSKSGSDYINTYNNGDALIPENSYIKDTVTIWKDGAAESTATSVSAIAKSVSYKAPDNFSVEIAASTDPSADNYNSANVSNITEINNTDTVVWWYTITNKTSSVLTLKVNSTLEASGSEIKSNVTTLSGPSPAVDGASFKDGVLTLPSEAVVHLRSGAFNATMFGSKTLENTIIVSADDVPEPTTATSMVTVKGDPAVSFELLYKKNGETETSASEEIAEGKDKLTFVVKITNKSTSELTFDLSNALTVEDEPITLNEEGLAFTLTNSDGENKPTLTGTQMILPAGTTATLTTDTVTAPYVTHEADNDTTPMQFTVTATNSENGIPFTFEPLKLNIKKADEKEFKVIPSYSLDGVNFFEFTDDADLVDEIAHVYDKKEDSAYLPPLKVKFRITIENISETKTLYFCLKEEQGTVTPPKFTGSPNKTLEHGLTDEVLSIKPKESATLVFPKDKDEFYEMERKSNDFEDLENEEKKTIFSFDVNEIKKNDSNIFGDVHGYHTQTRNVTLTYVEGVFGYSLSLGADADFENITPEFGDDVDSSRLYNVNEKDGGTQELYLIGTTGTGAKKYVHASGHTIDYFADNAKDPIYIVNDVPVAGKSHPGYQFVCWFDKNGTTKKVYMPGNPITKNTSSQHTVDAIWVGLQVDDATVVYDGNSHNLGTITLDLAGKPTDDKYDFYDIVPSALGKAIVTYWVKKNGVDYASGTGVLNTSTDGKTRTITLNEPVLDNGVATTGTEAPLTDVGVYQFEIKADYQGKGDVDPLPATCSATLTILPRPVVMQVASGSVDWDSFAHTLTDVPGMTNDKVVSIDSAFDGENLKEDVSDALSAEIKKITGADEVSEMLKIYKSADGGFATDEGFKAGSTPVVKYYPEGRTETEATETVKDAGTYVAFISNIAALQAAKKTAAAAIAADKPDPVVSAEGNYVFIGLPGELTIGMPKLSGIEITKNVVDASFTEGTFTFEVAEVDATGNETPIQFVPDTKVSTLYVMKGMSEGAATGESQPITLTVTKGTEETPSASVILKVPVGKTYVIRETAATFTPNDGRTLDDYTKKYEPANTANNGAKVTIAANATDADTAKVTVTNTANFYLVQNYVSDLDDEGNPVKHNNNKNVLEGYPGYVADGELLRRTFAPDKTTTYADVHKNETEGGHSSALVDQSIESGNQPDASHLMPYNYKYDATGDGYMADAEDNKYNANKTYLGKVGSAEAVNPGDTVNIFWDRVLEYSADPDGRYVYALKQKKKNGETVTTSNEESNNAIRQSQITYDTDYMLWGSLHNENNGQNSAITGKLVKDSWQQVNAIDLTFKIDKDYSEKSTAFDANTPRYIFNTVVTTQVNGNNNKRPDPITVTDNEVFIDNIKGGSTNTKLYLTPLIKVKYFVDDGTGTPKAEDEQIYTLKPTVVGDATNSAVGDGEGKKYAYTFTVPEHSVVGVGGEYVQSGRTDTHDDDFWLLKTYEGQAGGVRLNVGHTHEIKTEDLYHYSNGIHVDPNGYLVVALYLTPAKREWQVTKSVEVYDGETKLEDSAVATFGNTLKYTVTVKNTGNVPLTKVYLRDDAIATPTEGEDIKLSIFGNDKHKIGVTVESSKEGVTRTFTPVEGYRNFGTIDQIDPNETVTLTYSYVVGDNVKRVSNSVTVDDDDDLSNNPDDKTKPVTKETYTPIRNWSVAKAITGVVDKDNKERKPDAEGNYTLRVGDTIMYAVKITNTGDADLDELTVKDDFLRNGHTASASALRGPTLTSDKEPKATFEGGKLKNLHKGETVTLTYTYEVVSADQTLLNVATVTDSEGGHPRESTKINTPVTSFSVTKQVARGTTGTPGNDVVVKTGDLLVYTIVVKNTGGAMIPKLTVEDVIEELEPGKATIGMPSVDAIELKLTDGWSGYDEKTKTITGLPSGSSITLVWNGYTVHETNRHIKNTATVSDGVESVSDSAEARVKSWTVEKSVTGMSGTGSADLDHDGEAEKYAAMNDTLIYTVTVTNTGDVPMTLFVEDALNGTPFDLTGEDVDVEYAPKTEGDKAPSLEQYDGQYAMLRNLQPGQNAVFTYEFVVTEDRLKSDVLNAVKVHAAKDPDHQEEGPDVLGSDPHKETRTPVEAWTLDKQLTAVNGVKPSEPTFGKDAEDKEDENALVYPAVRVGDVLTYVVTVENTGSASIAAIAVDDKLTGGANAMTLVFDSDSTTTTFNGNTIHNLPTGAKATLTYTYKVAAGDTTLVNAVSAYQPEAPNKTQEKTVTTPIKDWTVTKEVYKGETPLANEAEVAVGDVLTYVVTVKNTGTVELKGLTLTDVFTNGEGTLDGMKHLVMDTEESADAEYAAGTWTIQPGGKLVLKAGYTVQPASQNPERKADTQLTNTVTVTDDDEVQKSQTVKTHVRGWKVTKTVSADTVLPGTHLTYSIQIENTGDVTLNLTLEDVFTKDKTTEDITANLKPDGDANAGTEATFDNENKKITGLEPGETFTLYWNYDVPAQSTEKVEQLVNAVTVDDDRDDFPPQSAEAETLVKNWSVAKSITGVTYLDSKGQEAKRDADTDGKYTLRPGDKVTYQVTVKNTGDEKLTLYVEDSLFIEKIAGEDWESKKEALEKALTVKLNDEEWKGWALFEDNSEGDHDGECLIQLKKLPIGATVTLTYTFTVPESSKGNEDLFTKGVNNLVYVHANDPETDPETNPKPEHNSEIDPHAQTESRLEAWTLDKAITKVMRGEDDVTANVVSWGYSVQLGDVVTYTITIANKGGTTIDRLNVTDKFTHSDLPGGRDMLAKDDLTFWSSKGMNGATLDSDSESAIFVANLSAGETVTLTFTHTVNEADRKSLVNVVTVTRQGEETSQQKSVEVGVQKTFSWSVEKTVEGMSSEEFINGLQCAKVGETLTYKITVTNTGSETLSGLKLEDVFNGNGLKGQQPPIKQVEPDPKTQSYYDKETHIINNLGVGQSVTLAYDYTVVASDIELVNTATVSQPGGSGTPQTSEVTAPVETTPAWKVTKEVYKGKYTGKEGDVKLADGAAVSVGDELTYVITVENTGNTSLRKLSVKDVFGGKEIQKELKQFSHDNKAAYDSRHEQIGTLEAGRRIVLTYAHKVTEDDTAAGLINAVTVTLPGEEETDKDKDHHAEVGNPVSAWTITKELTASDGMLGTRAVQIGDTMTYTITIANNGSAEIESLTVEDELIVTGWQYPQLDDMRLSADAPEGVTFTRSSVKDKNGKDTPANTGVLEHLGAGQTAKIECTYKVPGGVYYTSNAARAYPTGRKDEEQKTDPVIMPMYAVVTVHKIWTNADGKRLGANELKQLIGNTEVKFDILRANRTDSAFKPMTDANGVPYGVTLSANETPTWTRDFRSVVRLGNSPDEDDYRLYDVQERGVQTDKDGKTKYVMLNGHRFYYGKSYDFDGKTFNFTFTNELEGAVPTPTPTPGTTSSASATPTPTPSAYVPFTPTPGPAADAKYRVTKTAVNPPARGYYVEGETVQYSIRVQNTGMVPIDALTITDHLSGVTFTSGAGYDLTGAREAFIDHLSAGMSVEIYASYVVTAADVKRGCVTNTVSGDGGTGPDGRPASGNAAEATVPTNDSTYDVTVHYLYLTDGTTAAPDDKINRLRPGDAYRFSCPTIDGYYASSLTVTGTMPAHDVEITVYYVPEDLLPSNGRGGPGLILLDEYGIPLGVGRVMLNVGDCFE